MANVITNAGELIFLDNMLAGTIANQGTVLKLFRTLVTPSATSTVASFVEANFSGYSAETITSWNPATTVGGKAVATAASVVKTNSGATQTIYGHFVTSSDGLTLLYADLYDSPVVVTTGVPITVIPTFSLYSEN